MAGKQEGRWDAWAMGTPVAPQAHPANQQAATWVPVDYIPSSPSHGPASAPAPAPAPASYMNYSVPPSASSAHVGDGVGNGGNPYVHVSPVPGSTGKSPMEMILRVLNRCGKKLEEHSRKAGDAAGNVWHYLKTGPSVTDAAMARLAQGTKVLAEGGCDKVFQQTFGILPGEQLKKAYACYLSTSSGPVMGTLYISTRRLAFCSDKPLCYNVSQVQEEWIYYQVVVGLEQLRSVNSSVNVRKPAEKYIQIVTVDNHEIWFMGFVSYDKALKNLREALQHSNAHHFNIHY